MSAEQKLTDFDYFQISNIQRIGDKLRIRLLAEKKPAENAKRVAAGLEDVFLYILDCRKRKIEVDFVFHKKVCKNFTNTLDNLSLKEVEGLR